MKASTMDRTTEVEVDHQEEGLVQEVHQVVEVDFYLLLEVAECQG